MSRAGKQTFIYDCAPRIAARTSIVGPKEGKGPLADQFDILLDDDLLGEALHLTELTAPMFTSVVLIFLGTTLTGIGVYDKIGRYAGAGSIVPITGFANSVAAPAIEYRREGMVMGVGARIFQLAGPVLAYGITSSMLVGVLYWIARMWFL